jgi:hypothetical protein
MERQWSDYVISVRLPCEELLPQVGDAPIKSSRAIWLAILKLEHLIGRLRIAESVHQIDNVANSRYICNITANGGRTRCAFYASLIKVFGGSTAEAWLASVSQDFCNFKGRCLGSFGRRPANRLESMREYYLATLQWRIDWLKAILPMYEAVND